MRVLMNLLSMQCMKSCCQKKRKKKLLSLYEAKHKQKLQYYGMITCK